MSHGRTAPSGRSNELSIGQHPNNEPLGNPGSVQPLLASQPSTTSQAPTMLLDHPGMYPDDPDNQQAMIMALQRQSAHRHVSGRGGFQRRGQPVSQGQGTPCHHCKGTHPDIPNGKCPTIGAAAKDEDFSKDPMSKQKACHWLCNKKFRCNGMGHLARHHRAELELSLIHV